MPSTSTAQAVVLTQCYADAVVYASALHADQARKSTTIPYISHLLGVSSLVLEAGGDEDMAIAGLLRNALEDQCGQMVLDEITKCFGSRASDIVVGSIDSEGLHTRMRLKYSRRYASGWRMHLGRSNWR